MTQTSRNNRAQNLSLLVLIASLCSGCSIHQPLLVRDQAKLIVATDSRLAGLGEQVQAQISASNSESALVVLPSDPSAKAIVFPASGPLDAAVDHSETVASGQVCIVVFKRSVPLAPERFSCSMLARDAAKMKQITTDLEQMKFGLQENKRNLESVGKLVAPMAGLIEFHERQIRTLESTIKLLTDDYGKAAGAIAVNNDQLQSLINDLNKQYVEVKNSLAQMQQKLSTIK